MMRTTLFLAAVLLGASVVDAVKIADITRIGGQRTNILTGLGIVVGLPGTGDGGEFLPAIRPLAAMLEKFSNQAALRELKDVRNVALVSLTATVPANGARDGDKLDVHITAIGSSSSLRGGQLFITPMTGPVPGSGIYALAAGRIEIEDAATPTAGVIKGGCVMEVDLVGRFIENGSFALIIDEPAASWTNASTIAKIVNDAEGIGGQILATAVDPRQVVVIIPPIERERPDSFVSRVQRLPVPQLPSEARVQINQKTGTMIVTGDVEISPVVISHRGLTITTVNPAPVPSLRTPVTTRRDMVPVDTTGTGGARLQDLVNAFDQLKVPAEDRITIVMELHKTGKLHAKLLVE